MPAQSQYFTSIINSFASFLELHQAPAEIKEEATLLLLAYLKNKKNFSNWNIRELEFFLENNREAAQFGQHPKEYLTQFVRRYPPYQTSVMLHQYQLALMEEGCSQSTIKNYRSDINQFLQFSKETLLNLAFRKPKVVEFVRYQRQKGLKRSSVRRKLVSLSQFAIWAQKQGVLEESIDWLDELAEKVEEIDSWDIEGSTQAGIAKSQAEKNIQLPLAPTPTLQSTPANTKKGTVGTAQSKQEFRARLKQHLSALSSRVDSGRKKQLLPIVNTAMFVLFILGGGFFGYQQFIKNANTPFAFPSTLTRPNRTLSFQGRLTDSAKNPIVSATNARFKLYDSGPSVAGGTILWDSGTCVLDPDQDGIFSTGLGDDCGSEIGNEVFSENSNVWLQVEIDNGSSYEVLEPRQSIKTVPYALNSETLQGFPASMSATENTVLVMDENGDVNLGSLNPDLRSTSGTFTIEAEALVLQTASGSNGDIVFAPDGTGQVTALSDLSVFGDLTSTGYITAPGATLSATYAGGKPLVLNGVSGQTANLTEWNDGNGNVTVVDEDGRIGIGTSSPGSNLHIYNSSPTLTMENATQKWTWRVPAVSDPNYPKDFTLYDETFNKTPFIIRDNSTTDTLIISGNNVFTGNGVGVNTSSLTSGAVLDVRGNSGAGNQYTGYFQSLGASSFGTAYGIFSTSNSPSGYSIGGYFSASNGAYGNYALITDQGSVGIGNTSPNYKLDVSGDINLTGALRVGGDEGTAGYLLTSSGGGANTWTDPSSFAGTDDQTLAEVLTEGNTTGGSNMVFSTTDELRFHDDDADQRIYASADGTLNIESANLAINTSSWDISTGGTATGFTSLTASGTIQGGNLTDGTATLSSGTLDLGTNTISDGNFNGNWAFNSGNLSGIGTLSMSGQLTNSVTTGTAPFSIASTTLVTNLNADLLDGLSSADFCQANGTNCSASAGGWTDDGTVVRLTTSTDQVGIGTSSPASQLHVHNNSSQSTLTISTNVDVGSGNAAVLTFDSDLDGSPNSATIGQYGDGSLRLSGGASLVTPHMVITDAGDVGIGTDSPGYLLDVSGVGQLENLRLTDLVAGGANTSVLALDGSNNVDLIDISGYDTDGSDDLTTSTSFSGDVSGLYNDLQLGSGVVGSTEISDGAILEVDLSATNSPTDDYILSYDLGSGGFTWVPASTGTDDQTLAEVLAEGYTTSGNNMVFSTTDEIRFYDDDADSRIYSSADGTINLNSTNIAIDTSTWDISTAGAVSGLTTLSMSGQLTSSVTTGTAPFSIASTTLVTNLNADLLDGQHASDFMAATTDNWIDEIGDTITGSLNFSGVSSDITTAGNEHLALMPGGTGNVGIGLTTPGYKLDVSGDINLSGALRAAGDAGTSGYLLTSSAGGAMTWTDPSTLAGDNWWDNTDNLLHPIGEYAGVADLAIGGNSTASANIHLQSSGQAYFAGNVGIGDNAPGSILSVLSAGNVATNFAITNNVSGTPQTIVNYKYNTSSNLGRMSALEVDSTASLYLYSTATRGLGLGAGSSATPHLYINPSGQVGIGSTTPSYQLDVGGTLRATDTVNFSGLVAGGANTSVLALDGSNNVDLLDISGYDTDASDDVTGTGTENYLTKWDATGQALTNSLIFDDGTKVSIGTNTPLSKFHISNQGDSPTNRGLILLEQWEDQDIIGASHSGSPVFRVNKDGEVISRKFIDRNHTSYFLDASSIDTSLTLAGSVGIGTLTPSAKLHIDSSTAATSEIIKGAFIDINETTGSGSYGNIGVDSLATYNGSGTHLFSYGFQAKSINENNGTISYSSGLVSRSQNSSTGIISLSSGTYSEINNSGGGTITDGRGLDVRISNSSGSSISSASGLFLDLANTSTITNSYGVRIDGWTNSGTITNAYGIYIGSSTSVGSTLNYAMYSGSTADSYFAGDVGIGTTNPAAELDIDGVIHLSGAATEERAIEIGMNRTGSGSSYVDLIGDTTYSDYGLRLIRNNTGANANSRLIHRGTGYLELIAADNGNIALSPGSGKVGVGTTTPETTFQIAGADEVRSRFSTRRANSYPYFEVSHRGWGNSTGLLWNAYAPDTFVNGNLLTSGNTKYKFDPDGTGSTAGGAGIIHFDGNARRFDIRVSPASTNAGTNIAWSPGITLDSTGVGIGTTTPSSILDVGAGGSNNYISIARNGNDHGGIRWIRPAASNTVDATIYMDSLEDLRIKNDFGGDIVLEGGSVGIGTTSPAKPIHVYNSSNWDLGEFQNNSSIARVWVRDANGYCIYTSTTGAVCSSDRRLKKDITTIEDSLEAINSLRPVRYHFLNDENDAELKIGFIAQEVESIVPELVSSDEKGYKSINYASFTPLLAGAIQEQQLQIQKNSSALQNIGSLSINDSGQVALSGSNGSYQVTVQGQPSSNLLASARAVVGRIQSGLINTRELVVTQTASINSLSVNSLSINGQSLQNYIAGIILQMSGSQSATNSSELVSPVAELDGLEVNGKSKLADLLVSDSATFSGQLNAGAIETDSLEAETSRLGSLLTDNATVSGTLTAENIEAATISAHSTRLALLESRLAEFEHIKSTTAELVDATVSGTLYADNIVFKNKIATAENKPSILEVTKEKVTASESGGAEDLNNLQPLYDSVADSGYQASSSAELDLKLEDLNLSADDVTLTAQATFIDNYFRVNGTAYIADSLGIGNQLLVGNGTQIADGTFSYTAPAGSEQILHIQPHGQGILSLMAGLMTLTDDGSVTINGSLNVAGNLKVEDTLLTNLIQPAEFGNPFQVQVAGVNADSEEVQESRFEIINELGSPVATISAQGRADFAAGIGIGSEELGAPGEGSDNEVDSSKSSGRATLSANSKEITIKSSLISENSLIYVTPVGSTQNQVLYVKSQEAGEKFVVGFDEAIDESVNFNWWIVN